MSVGRALRDALKTDSAFWRRALRAGVEHGPDALVRYSPALIGAVFGAALSGPRTVVRDHLRLALGERSTATELQQVMAVFANFASSMTEAMLVASGRGYHATCRPIEPQHFLSVAAENKGVIVATAQTAGWDLAGASLRNDHGDDVWVLMEREPNHTAGDMHDRFREASGVHIVHVGDDPLASLPVLRHLRGGGVVALKFDRAAAGMRTRGVRLFGQPWRIPEGPLSLASLSGAAIVPVLSYRTGFLSYDSYILPPLRLPRRPREDQLDRVAQQLADHLETFVRRHPTQWFRFHAAP